MSTQDDPTEGLLSEQALEEVLLGGAPEYTQAEIAEKAGLPTELALRIWQALGFPTPPEDATAFTRQDMEALGDIRGLLDNELVDEALVLHLSRAVGQTMGRLASWLGDVWVKRVAETLFQPGQPLSNEDVARTVTSAQELLPTFERLMLQGWRRQLAASGLRTLALTAASAADPALGTANLAVGFADVVSFTRLSRQMDGDTLAEFVERFEEAASETCADLGGRIVKTLGDEVLFSADDPAAAAEIALRLAERVDHDEGFPRLRVGVAYGEVIQRLGDVFGTPVNLAARLTSVAYPGTVLVDQQLAAEVGADYEVVGLRPRSLQGLGRVRPCNLRRKS
jgi:adenylate cyclase